MDKVRRHITFSGRVQGVGFRYTACSIARSLGLTGWVRNLWDGDVEMEVQGRSEEIDHLTEGLRKGNFIRIDGMVTEEIPVVKERGFREIY